MHFLIGLGIVAGLIAFAFGKDAAAAFVGIVLLAIAAGFVAIVYIWAQAHPML